MLKPTFLLSFLLSANIIFAQYGKVCSSIHDDAGDAIPGVTVQVKGTTNATMTDADGNYCIDCNVDDVLVMTYVGMATQEIQVTPDMFTSPITSTQKNHVDIDYMAVTPIKSDAYSKSLVSNTNEDSSYSNMHSASYWWQYERPGYNYYFHTGDYKKIIFRNNSFRFVKATDPLKFEILFNTTAISKKIINLYNLQSTYAQGIPSSGVNTWFGADNNEIFSWGPAISNLVFNASSYSYDINGRLIHDNQTNAKPAIAYNTYDIFKKALLFKNSINLRVKKGKNHYDISYINKRERGLTDQINVSDNFMKFRYKGEYNNSKSNWYAGLSYYSGKNNFAGSNLSHTKLMSSIMLTPPTFDNSQAYMLSDGTQRSSAPDYKNNPYFLLNANKNKHKTSSLSADFSYNLRYRDLKMNLSGIYDRNAINEELYINNNTAGYINSFNRKRDKIITNTGPKIYIERSFYFGLDIQTQANYNYEELTFLREIENTSNFKLKKVRNSLNWSQSLIYEPEFLRGMNIRFKNNIYIADKEQKWFLPVINIGYNITEKIYNSGFSYLIASASYSYSAVEQSMYMNDKSYSTTNIDLNQINTFLESDELFYNKDLDLETRQTYNIGLRARSRNFWSYSNIYFSFNYEHTVSENSIFPVYKTSSFELDNIAEIKNQTYEANLGFSTRVFRKVYFDISCIFSKSDPVVREVYNGYNQIPIAGFQPVSKNLIKGEAVGVIVGSAYQRNDEGKLIIGSNGLPLVAADKQIIGNPNPDYYMAFKANIKISNILEFEILFDHQKGGDIWNGTKNTLNYYGLSENTAIERGISNYVFEGVNESGQINTTAVDFANPANGLAGNKWYNYGIGGVAEEAIEDGTWIRLKQIAVSYTKRFKKFKFIRNIELKLFANNLWINTKYSGSSPISYFNNYAQGKGIDYFNMPDTKEIGLRISLTF
ncbi:MAG: hypothetical protein GY756_01345 [bacterium]|nr:hypothetical protein [bacterium]